MLSAANTDIATLYQSLKSIYPIAQYIVFFGFFIFSAVCIYLSDENEFVKKVFVIAVIIGLAVPAIFPYMFPPFNSMNKFTDPAPDSQTGYELVIVGSDGEEYNYPNSASPPTTPPSYFSTADGEEQLEMSAYLCDNVLEYENKISNGGITVLDKVRAKTPLTSWVVSSIGNTIHNTPQTRKPIDSPLLQQENKKIDGIRIYRTITNTSDDSFDIENTERTQIYEYGVGNDLCKADD